MEMKSERYFTKEKAQLEVYGKAGTVIADMKNLSGTGACLEWTQDDVTISKGDLVRVTVYLKTLKRRHNLSGEVIWRDGKKTGITFIRPDQVLDKMADRT
jgi:PilZ domain